MRNIFHRSTGGFSSTRFLLSMNAQLFELLQTIGNNIDTLLNICSQVLMDTWLETDYTVAIYLQQVEKYDTLAA
jgi:hypothetical protein